MSSLGRVKEFGEIKVLGGIPAGESSVGGVDLSLEIKSCRFLLGSGVFLVAPDLARDAFLVRGVDLLLLRDLDREFRCEFAMLIFGQSEVKGNRDLKYCRKE